MKTSLKAKQLKEMVVELEHTIEEMDQRWAAERQYWNDREKHSKWLVKNAWDDLIDANKQIKQLCELIEIYKGRP